MLTDDSLGATSLRARLDSAEKNCVCVLSVLFYFFFHAFWSVLGVAATVHALFNEQ